MQLPLSWDVKPFIFTAPEIEEFHEHFIAQDYACRIVAWMEADLFGRTQVGINEILDPVAVFEKFLRVCAAFDADVVDKTESAYGAWGHTETPVHSLRACKAEFSLVEHMLEGMDVKVFVAFETDKVMPVSLVVAHEKVFAVGGIYVLPVCKCLIDGKKRRMVMYLIAYAVLLEPSKRLLYFF